MLSDTPLIKILILNLRGLDLEVPSYSHLLKLDLSSRALSLFQDRPSDSLIVYLDWREVF